MQKLKPSVFEWSVLGFVFGLVATGFILFYTDDKTYTIYTEEDSFVEWITVLGLLLGSAVGIYRGYSFLKKKSWLAMFANFFLGLILFAAAGEEISWGQRILGIESSEYFVKNNTQGETNFHNLVINGVRINQVIFTFTLIGVLTIYLLIIPYQYRRNKKVKSFIDYCGIPLPRAYQIISFVLLFIITSLLPHGKRAELLEMGTAFILYLIITFPFNQYLFSKSALPDKVLR